jgi:hypothetical protein
MTLTESLLPKLSEWRPAGDGRHSLATALPEAGWAAHLTADKADSLSCLVWELTLSRTSDAPEGLTLKAWAEGVAKRATGLLPPKRASWSRTTKCDCSAPTARSFGALPRAAPRAGASRSLTR